MHYNEMYYISTYLLGFDSILLIKAENFSVAVSHCFALKLDGIVHLNLFDWFIKKWHVYSLI